ncbi:MAG: zinc ribbon domain-containing protein [Deltaproteobacteria bacterium]|nr:zinc ribbon domain-containing protein [Deltaproteobacteria bacterium]
MPIFEYQCQKCNEVSEVFIRNREKAPTKCETCGGKLKRIISPAGFQFKGTGWYVTDYARKGKKDKDDSSTTSGSSAETPKSPPKEEKKPEKKATA